MTTHSQRLLEHGIVLPPVAKPVASYVPAIRSGNLVFTSGQLPTVSGQLQRVGQVGSDLTLAQGTEAARVAALNAVSAAASEAGGLDRVRQVVRVAVYVASAAEFYDQPKVANGASELLAQIFGPACGSHTRSAIGVSVLPLNAPVEVELVVELDIA